MIALRLEYLTGRAVMTAFNDRGGAEWPPHPARVYSALVATWAEQEALDSVEALAERAALEWLESLPPPTIACQEGSARRVMTHYVPTNDVSLLPARLESLSAKRQDAERSVHAAQSALQATPAETKEYKARSKALASAQKVFNSESEKFLKACGVAFSETALTAAETQKARQLLPDGRLRQPRSFPSLALPDPVVVLSWQAESTAEHWAALKALANRLVRIGHSSSFVHAQWVHEAPPPNWLPSDEGELLLRVVGPGQFARLCAEFELHQGVEPRVLPYMAQRYRAVDETPTPPIEDARTFDDQDWIILRRVGGPALPLTRGVELSTAIRSALMRHADQPPAEILSGHSEDGAPSQAGHAAIVPLPHVGHRHADGRIVGVALLIPRQANADARRAVFKALGRWEQDANAQHGDDAPILIAGLGDGIELELERQVWGEARQATLKPGSWSEPAREWLSVTPVALDRNPGDLCHSDPAKRDAAFRAAAECIAKACLNVGLPLPESVIVLPSGTWPGGAKAAKFPPYPSAPGKLRRVKVHARIRFRSAQQGPVILGAGRYQGLGLFKPVSEPQQ